MEMYHFKKVLTLIICLTSILFSQEQRQRLSFDFNWKFLLGDIQDAEKTDFDDSTWRNLNVPHDWSIEGSYNKDEPVGGNGAFLPTGIGWYRKHFTLPVSAKDKSVRIEFDGIYMNSDVWINGYHLGKRPYGYISFQYDLTPYLNQNKNVVAVRVDNSQQPNTRWYSGSGIYRHVWLTIADKIHIAMWGIAITTPYAKEDSASINISTKIENQSENNGGEGFIQSIITNADGKEVARGKATFNFKDNKNTHVEQVISLKQPSLWSVESPYLYTLHSQVIKNGKTIDDIFTPFGIRAIEYSTTKGFLLNGKHIKMKGVNLHHDGGIVGAAVPVGVWERRLKILKTMGCNAIRTSHNPPAPEFLDLCDRLGFLVMDEAFDEWKEGKRPYGYHLYFDEWGERDLVAMIQRDRNHPSVVLWSIGNEIREQPKEGGYLLAQKLTAIVHHEDPTRPSTLGCDNIAADDYPARPEFLKSLDIVGYNYVDRWHERRELYYSIDKLAHPDWLMIGTESVSNGGIRGEYSLGDDPNVIKPSYNFRMIRAEQLWKFVSSHDYVIGDFMWTGIDYLGESRWPYKNNPAGVIDMCGFPKDGFYFYQSQWTKQPMIHLFPHWNWPGREGQVIPVLCYTNCDAVELFLNGKSFGEKRLEFPRQGTSGSWNGYDHPRVFPTTTDLHLSWDIPYEPGVLKAIGRRNSEVVTIDSVCTTGPAYKIQLKADKQVIKANNRDVVHLVAEIVDEKGFLVPGADNKLEIKVTGAGKVLGIGSGNAANLGSFQSTHCKAFNGLLLVIIQAIDKEGKITCKIESDGLPGVQATVEVVK